MKKHAALTSCALFTALIAVGAQIAIPLPLDMRLTL
jgi:biotin transporter BioY